MNNLIRKITSCISLLLISFSSNINAQESPNKFGVFDSFSEVGAPKIPCTLNYDEHSQTYRIAGSSTTWFAKDNCAFLWKKMSGDFIVQTQVKWSSETTKSHRKVGIMIRSSLALDTTMIALTNREGCLYRKIPKTNLEKLKFELKSPADVGSSRFAVGEVLKSS
jgi:hypothetical protein